MKPETIFRALVMRLLDQWDDDVMVISSMEQIMEHPHVEALMSLGEDVVPLVIERMKSGNLSWGYFSLLHRLTGVDPVPEEERGKVQAMAQRWIEHAG